MKTSLASRLSMIAYLPRPKRLSMLFLMGRSSKTALMQVFGLILRQMLSLPKSTLKSNRFLLLLLLKPNRFLLLLLSEPCFRAATEREYFKKLRHHPRQRMQDNAARSFAIQTVDDTTIYTFICVALSSLNMKD